MRASELEEGPGSLSNQNSHSDYYPSSPSSQLLPLDSIDGKHETAGPDGAIHATENGNGIRLDDKLRDEPSELPSTT